VHLFADRRLHAEFLFQLAPQGLGVRLAPLHLPPGELPVAREHQPSVSLGVGEELTDLPLDILQIEHVHPAYAQGIRRRGRIAETIEKFSVIKAMQAIEKAHVVIFLIDSREGVTDQDANLLGMVLEIGRGLIVGLNKWDGMTPDQRDETRRQLDLRLQFIDFAEKYFISALHGTGVGHLFDAVREVYASTMTDMGTSRLTRLLQEAVTAHQPPLVRGRRIKLKYAHQGGSNPPTIVIHGNQVDEIPGSYKRFLINHFRQALEITGTPIKLEFRAGENPYKGKRNTLTDRQVKKRRRMIRHVK